MNVKLTDEQKRLIFERDLIIKLRANLLAPNITDVLRPKSLEYDLTMFKELNKSLNEINKKLGL